MNDIQRTIDYFKNKLQSGISKGRKKQYENAVSAMEELQQYREIGTVEQVKNQKHNLGVAYKMIEEYQAIGTHEECREARERQQVRKPLMGSNPDIPDRDIFICQVCSGVVGIDDVRAAYCADCGQAIDWKEE